MTPTDKLRALLDERGIEWWTVESLDKVPLTVCVINGVRYKFRPQGRGIIVSSCTEGTVTAEQAIAMTVGVGTCELINAADDLGKGTSSCMCFKCGYTALDDWWDEFNYCPQCGARITKED